MLDPRSPDGGWPLLVVVALCCALAGCSAAQTEDGTGRGAGNGNRPRHGGVLRVQLERPRTLDPIDAESVYESVPVNQVFDGLVATDPGLNLIPALAATWTISRDNRTFTFRLRDGVRFHDGSPLTAEDVVYTFQRALSPRHADSTAAAYVSVIEGAADYGSGRRRDLPGVISVDATTVTIRLERPYLSFLEVLTLDGLRIVPRHVIEAGGEQAFGRAPVGTGPFRLESWSEDRLRLEANADYFTGPPHLDAVEISFPGDGPADSSERLLAGELDVAEVSPDRVDRLAADPRMRVHRVQELSVSFLGLLTGMPPLDDVRVRQAIAHAIDRDALVAEASDSRREALGILPPGLPGYSPTPKALAHDPARSRALLAEAGYPGGRGVPAFAFYTSGQSAASTRVLERVRDDLAAVGIRVEPKVIPWVEITQRLDDHSAPLFMLGWVADLADPDAFLRALFQSRGSANLFDFEDLRADALLDYGAREMNPVRRVRIYREAERRILELAPLVPLYHSVGILATGAGVHGFEPGPLGISAVELQKVWLAPRGATH